jgi:serine/threonine protein kinase
VAGYTILGELGRGATGVVYRARHEKLKRIVVLKMLQAGPDAGPQHLARFHAEAEAVARLHHPNIVQIYESGEHDGLPYLALEFVGGGTLKGRLEGTPQPVRPAVQLVEVLARAIHAAHARGLVHRDLKPANILLAPPEPADDGDDAGNDDLAFERFYGVPKIRPAAESSFVLGVRAARGRVPAGNLCTRRFGGASCSTALIPA